MIAERLKEFLDAKGLSLTQLEREIGTGNGTLVKAYKARTSIGTDKLEKILLAHPDLSAEWVLRGTGEMTLSSRSSSETATIKALEKQIALLTEEKNNYWHLIMKLTEER